MNHSPKGVDNNILEMQSSPGWKTKDWSFSMSQHTHLLIQNVQSCLCPLGRYSKVERMSHGRILSYNPTNQSSTGWWDHKVLFRRMWPRAHKMQNCKWFERRNGRHSGLPSQEKKKIKLQACEPANPKERLKIRDYKPRGFPWQHGEAQLNEPTTVVCAY